MARIHTLDSGEVIIRDDWDSDDIQSVADDYDIILTEAQILEVMDNIVEGFDANFGITWDSVREAIEQVTGV